jgi:7,8-dihydropterin-6-yl-methyl-4-(beta-D-ribofuranosyl)aminobenzene 5'-phosphate synthase
MGGVPAHQARRVTIPPQLGLPQGIPCFLPDRAEAPGLQSIVVEGPRALAAGIASTGPLARSLFFLGYRHRKCITTGKSGQRPRPGDRCDLRKKGVLRR